VGGQDIVGDAVMEEEEPLCSGVGRLGDWLGLVSFAKEPRDKAGPLRPADGVHKTLAPRLTAQGCLWTKTIPNMGSSQSHCFEPAAIYYRVPRG
jgi:hypothetical protein